MRPRAPTDKGNKKSHRGSCEQLEFSLIYSLPVSGLSQGTLAENGGDDPFAGQLLHEPIQEARLHQLRR